MATRLYFRYNQSPDVTPSSWSTGWNETQASPVLSVAECLKGSTTLTTFTVATGTAAGPNFKGGLRFVYGPLAAGSIGTGQTVKGVMRCAESNAGANATLAIAIKFIQSGGSDRSIALAVSASDNTAATPPEMTTSLTNRRFNDVNEATSIALSNVSWNDGDYLVIEIGARKGTTTTRNLTFRYGDNSGSDLVEDDSSTSDYCAWIEFTNNITKKVTYGPTGGITPSGSLSNRSKKTLPGGVTPSGTLVAQKVNVTTKSLAGGMTPAGTLVRRIGRLFTGDL